MSVKQLGEIPGPITQEGPSSVPGEKSLTQDFSGPQEDETYLTRGYEVPSKVRIKQPGLKPYLSARLSRLWPSGSVLGLSAPIGLPLPAAAAWISMHFFGSETETFHHHLVCHCRLSVARSDSYLTAGKLAFGNKLHTLMGVGWVDFVHGSKFCLVW